MPALSSTAITPEVKAFYFEFGTKLDGNENGKDNKREPLEKT